MENNYKYECRTESESHIHEEKAGARKPNQYKTNEIMIQCDVRKISE